MNRNKLFLFAVLLYTAFSSGCAQYNISYQASLANLETIKAANIAALKVGEFSAASAEVDKPLSIRSNSVNSPFGNSFALLLKDAITQELKAAGKLNPDSGIAISGLLTKSSSDAPMSGEGHAELAANFTVTRDGAVVFKKELSEQASWPSSFVGVTAIGAAINNYNGLYQKLIQRLFGDEDFKKAAKP